jgi:hypothetical protein
MLILTYGDWRVYTRLLREKRVKRNYAGSEALKRLPSRPLKSERLERKSTDKINSVFRKDSPKQACP